MTEQHDVNRKMIEEFRATRDSTDVAMNGRPMLLLTTTGARSGERRATPMMFVRIGERVLVIASNIGAPKNPDWYHNLVAHPNVSVEIGAETFEGSAAVATGAERERLWNGIVEQYPFFVDHQAKTTRQIPVIALERR